MSELTDRIIEVLRSHHDNYGCCTGCDWQYRANNPDHAAHMADRVAELFTEVELAHFDGSSTIQWIFQRSPDSPSPVPASPNPPTSPTSVHSPHSGPEPTAGSEQ